MHAVTTVGDRGGCAQRQRSASVDVGLCNCGREYDFEFIKRFKRSLSDVTSDDNRIKTKCQDVRPL
jgi:hypothetical protein